MTPQDMPQNLHSNPTELTAKIDKNKIKQGKRWNKMIRKIKKRVHREKYMISLSYSQQRRRQKKTDSQTNNTTDLQPEPRQPKSKLNVKLPGIVKKLAKIKIARRRHGKRCEILGKFRLKLLATVTSIKRQGRL